MASFTYRRRVQFAETDMAGIVHFSCFVRYMEEAEHAWWRSLGLSIAPAGDQVGWPRVAVSCDFKAPLRFEDDVDVTIRVEALGRRSIKYALVLSRADQIVATGTMTSVCVRKAEDGSVAAVDVPADVLAVLG